MSENDIPKPVSEYAKMIVSDLATAATVLTRFPVPSAFVDPARLAQSTWTYSIVGAIVGLFSGFVLWLSLQIGLNPEAAAILSLGTSLSITGALHEDGIADCADGLGGGRDKETALAIMRDSRVGAYGVVVLCLFLIGRWSAIGSIALTNPILVMMFVGAVSRAPMTATMLLAPNARDDGMSRHVGRPALIHAVVSIFFAALFGLMIFGVYGIFVTLTAFLAAGALVLLALKKIEGQTGDVLGGSQQCAELTALILLASALT